LQGKGLNNIITSHNNNLVIVAHRGASYVAPENTIPSFKLAFKEEADFIEGDFWLTKDDEIVCLHDSDTKRITNSKIKLKIRSSTLAELKQLDFGSWKGNEYKETAIPTFQEVLQIIPEGKGIYIEIKDNREIFVQKLVEILKSFPIATKVKPDGIQIRIITFDQKTVQLVKKYLPEIKVYWLFGWYFLKKKYLISFAQKKIMRTLRTLNCDGIDIRFAPYIDERLVEFVHQLKLDFCVYNVERIEDAVRLINLGVDSITTNYPLRMREGIEAVIAKERSD